MDLPFHYNAYASIVQNWIAQTLLTSRCEIKHANAFTNRSTHLSFFVAALDFFPKKSTMMEYLSVLIFKPCNFFPSKVDDGLNWICDIAGNFKGLSTKSS
jgi:hypothetical protein